MLYKSLAADKNVSKFCYFDFFFVHNKPYLARPGVSGGILWQFPAFSFQAFSVFNAEKGSLLVADSYLELNI